jgi:hypothetical protein
MSVMAANWQQPNAQTKVVMILKLTKSHLDRFSTRILAKKKKRKEKKKPQFKTNTKCLSRTRDRLLHGQ